MISFGRLKTMLEHRSFAVSRLKREKIISGRTYDVLRAAMDKPVHEGLSIATIDDLCRALNCQPGDIMEYVPDDTQE